MGDIKILRTHPILCGLISLVCTLSLLLCLNFSFLSFAISSGVGYLIGSYIAKTEKGQDYVDYVAFLWMGFLILWIVFGFIFTISLLIGA